PAEAYRPQNPGPWWWRLPGQEHPAPQDAKLNPKSGELGDLGGVPENTGKKPVSRRPKGHIAKLRELGNVPADPAPPRRRQKPKPPAGHLFADPPPNGRLAHLEGF
ncbi:MAG TPA: hypothetical protein PKC45_00450, partial [Gemmatales bacterium]|nr:hypothetical protein [Gemmatales bacterium]